MSSFDDYFTKAVETGQIPGAVAFAINRDGKEIYSKAVGPLTIDPSATDQPPLDDDSVFWIASMTKIMTSIAALQCVERGQIGLDDDVSTVLTEFKNAEVLEGFDDEGKPILQPAKNKITLRRLLSHSSGLGYDLMHPKLIQYRKWQGLESQTLLGSIREGMFTPLVFEPGEGWEYGVSIDWAGQIVERLNGGIRLGEYMEKNIWDPLGMRSTTFSIPSRPDLAPHLMGMAARMPSGELVYNPTPLWPLNALDDCGGVGAYSSPGDYKKLLTAILQDGKGLFKDPVTVKLLSTDQLAGNGKALMDRLRSDEATARLLGWDAIGKADVSYGLGGMVGENGLDSGRKGGWVQWGGLPNLFWFVDNTSGIAASFFTQVVPTGDPQTVETYRVFEKSLYAKL